MPQGLEKSVPVCQEDQWPAVPPPLWRSLLAKRGGPGNTPVVAPAAVVRKAQRASAVDAVYTSRWRGVSARTA